MKPMIRLARVQAGFCLGLALGLLLWAAGCARSPGRDGPEIVTVVKVSGIPWFNRMEEGVRRAARELGIDAYQIGPSSTDEALQVRMVEDLVSKGVDAICVVPNDARALEPVFARARARGIKVITHESPSQREHDYNLEAIDNEAFGRYHVDKLVEFMGDTGDYVVFVGSLTAPTHNLWADVGIAYAQERYPGLRLVTDRIPFGDDQEIARQKTLEMLRAYPELKGMILFGSPGPPGAAQALKERGLADRVAVVGTVMPRHGAPYLKDGSVRHGTLWDPRDVGYAMSYLAKLLVEGGEIRDGLEIPGLGAIRLDGHNILLDGMLRITAENVDGLGF
jgi:simple sugar transport system substrate-binding protein